MEKVSSYEAKTHLSSLLGKVANGKSITITKHGVPIAEITPIPSNRKKKPDKVIEELKSFRKGLKLGNLTVRKMIEEGRRF